MKKITDYKIGVPIIVIYQAEGLGSAKTIEMDVYDETHAKDVPKCVPAMTEMGSTGRYWSTFTPDAEGEWATMMREAVPPYKGPVVKAYKVVGHGIDSVGDVVVAIQAKTDALPSDPADQSLVEAAIVVSEAGVRGTDNDTLKTVKDILSTKIEASPAMVA